MTAMRVEMLEVVQGVYVEGGAWGAVDLEIGSGVLASKFLSDPPRPEERARLRKAALRELTHAPDGDVERLVATGGTASNLPAVLARRAVRPPKKSAEEQQR